MDRIKEYSLYIVVGLALHLISVWLEAGFLLKFLRNNLVTIQIALLAINTSTAAILVSRMAEIYRTIRVEAKKAKIEPDSITDPYRDVRRNLKLSLTEQTIAVIITIVVSIFGDSLIARLAVPYLDLMVGTSLSALLILALDHLRDTAHAVFILADQSKEY